MRSVTQSLFVNDWLGEDSCTFLQRLRAMASSANKPSPPIVLCVEDNHELRVLYTSILWAAGYRCLPCESAQAAIVAVKNLPISAATLDFDMPDVNGAELAHALRVLRPSLPLLLMSGNLDLRTEDLKLFDEVCPKAGSPICLCQKLARLLGDGISPTILESR